MLIYVLSCPKISIYVISIFRPQYKEMTFLPLNAECTWYKWFVKFIIYTYNLTHRLRRVFTGEMFIRLVRENST